MNRESVKVLSFHQDPVLFREAISFTVNTTGFRREQLEKDYYCSVILSYLYEGKNHPMVFKGGSCLSKVYADFYRLSEDLDFAISLSPSASRSIRSKTIEPIRELVSIMPDIIYGVSLSGEFKGFNNSTQYVAEVVYHSIFTGKAEKIKVEVGLREKLLDAPKRIKTKTLLFEPLKGQSLVPEFTVTCMSLKETFSEKLRAALTRKDLAIRDFYDIDYAVRKMNFNLNEEQFLEFVKKKLAVPGNDPMNISLARKEILKRQLEAELKPILREQDFQQFDLDRAFNLVGEVRSKALQTR